MALEFLLLTLSFTEQMSKIDCLLLIFFDFLLESLAFFPGRVRLSLLDCKVSLLSLFIFELVDDYYTEVIAGTDC